MSKILLITSSNLYLTPYIKNYTSVKSDAFDVLYWDRHNLEENNDLFEHIHRFYCNFDENFGKIKKILLYFKFCQYAKRIIKKFQYEKVIFLQTFPAFLLNRFLRKKMKNCYVVDVRDYTFENNLMYKKIERKLFDSAYQVFISSDGFRNFLPKNDYILVHNYSEISDSIRDEFKSIQHSKASPICISFIGLIRFMEQNKKIIMFFKNDDRFVLKFIGKGANELTTFLKENDVNNVKLIDYFDPSKTLNYYKETDFIMNLYGNHTPVLDYAVSNKMYYSVSLYIPILVCEDTFMEKLTKSNQLGVTIKFKSKDELDEIANYWKNNNRSDFINRCDSFLEKVKKDNSLFEKKVQEYVDK